MVSGHCKVLARASAHAVERGSGYMSDAFAKTAKVDWSCAYERRALWRRTERTTTKADALAVSTRRGEYQIVMASSGSENLKLGTLDGTTYG